MLTQATDEYDESLSLHDRVQIALAIADPSLLKTLLVDCLPPVALPHQIGSIHATIGLPMATDTAVDGVIQFEWIHCQLIESPSELEQRVAHYTQQHGTPQHGTRRGYLDLTRCESETQVLGHGLTLAQALAILEHSGFTARQIDGILHLPQEAWHKSWWYMADNAGELTVPFLRLLRSRHYLDGSITLQYKDFFADEKPPCFKSQDQRVLVEIKTTGFRETLEKINQARQQFSIQRALLICDRLSDLETRGFISQGISIYAATEVVLPIQANCTLCANGDCPMQGRHDSPVKSCQRFCLNAC